jgi:hypothetical protein
MQKVDLNKVLEMLINEEHEEATGLLHEWFVEKSKAVHESLMQEDDELSQDIEDDQEAIKSEEFYSEAEGDDEAGEEEAGEEEGEEALDGEVEGDSEEAPFDGEAAEEPIEDRVEDLEAIMADLKAKYDALVGVEEPEHGMDLDGDGEIAAEPVDDMDLDMDGEVAVGDELETEESFAFESKDDEEFSDLEESWNLETVKDPNLSGGKEIGADGSSVSVNDKSPLPNHKPSDRLAGEPVEIDAEEHHGFDLEASPEVKSKPLLKNQVKKATDGRTKVSKEGDKSAMLNKKDGFGSDSPKSPVASGKRK